MRNASKWFSLLAAFTLCALSLALQAPEAAAGDNYLLLKAGVYDPQANDVESDLDTGFSGEIAVGHYFLPFLGAELGAGYFEASKSGNKLTVYPVTLSAKLRLPIPIVKPYAIAGGGAYFAKAEAPALGSQSDTAFGYFGGAGVDFKVAFLLINIEAKYLWAKPTFFGADTDIDGIAGTVGVGLEF
ncbi:MAG: outer membrane protein, OmpW-related [Deltaproteobacteria bacterium]|nr:outer membrane protein, OmpW-related [Deltaproteobacteria bacterium]